jgi:hypothetical protein
VTELVELNPGVLPADDAGRAALASYVQSLVSQAPAVGRVLLVPAPTTATASAYAAAFDAVGEAVHASAPGVAVGVSLDGALAPKAALNALGRWLTSTPDFVAFRPAPAAAPGAWTASNVTQLTTAAGTALGEAPPVLLDGVSATSNVAYASSLAGVACSASVMGVVFDRLVDNAEVAGASNGLYTATGAAKTGSAAVTTAAANAQRGLTVCPGVAIPAVATTLTYPEAIDSSTPVSLQIGCDRDCIYLVTLDNAAGRPVVATRGSLVGGAAASAVTLPQAKLAAGTYRLDVRLVNVANPAAITRTLSPPLTGA